MRTFKHFLKIILRSRVFLPALERYIASKIYCLNSHQKPELGILVLDVERFYPGELERLGERTLLYALPSDYRNLFYALFFTSDEVSSFRQYNLDDALKLKVRRFVDFLRLLLPRLAARLSFDCVVTCNYVYVQNKLIAKACKEANIPFIDLNRESKQDNNLNDRFKRKYEKMNLHLEFFGHAICVWNENTKQLLSELRVCPLENIHVVGSLRLDTLVRRVSDSKDGKANKTVTLFSFRHMPIGGDYIGYREAFSPDGTKGFSKLFDAVHSAFVQLAKHNPTTRFVIKIKWFEGEWFKNVQKAITRAGASLDELPNLRIAGADENSLDLIHCSRVVIGLNSTTLVEARLSSTVTVLPFFGEEAKLYADTLQYRDALSEFCVANSREELLRLVQHYLDTPTLLPAAPGVFNQYVGSTDGKNLDRVISVINKEIANTKAS